MEKIIKEDLIYRVYFKVIKAEYETKFFKGSNGVFGLGHNSWITGSTTLASFEVKPFESAIPVKKLKFFGEISGIGRGDNIAAYLHKEKIKDGKYEGLVPGRDGFYKKIYLPKYFKEEEKVSRIEKMSFDNIVSEIFDSGNINF